MERDQVVHMVGQSCRPDQVEKLTKWYDEKHIPDIMKFEGLKKATRCELIHPGITHYDYQEQNYPQYLNIYEFDNLQAFEQYEKRPMTSPSTGNDVRATWGQDPVERLWRVQYKVVRTFVK